MPKPYELNDHVLPVTPQHLPDGHRACSLQERLQMLAENCPCMDGGIDVCLSGNHERLQVLMREIKAQGDESQSLFTDVTSCANLIVAASDAINGMKDAVRLGLDAICTDSGVRGLVLEKHPHNVLSMVRAIAEVPRRTSTAMSVRRRPEVRRITPALAMYGSHYGVVAPRVCVSCTCVLPEIWWKWSLQRGVDDRWKPVKSDATYDGELPCGLAHATAVTLLARTGSLADGFFGDYCPHVAMVLRCGVAGNTLARYISIVMLQTVTQLGGKVGNHVGGWGAARVLATVIPFWDELWRALATDGEPLVPIASCAAYALASDYAEDVDCTVHTDSTVRYVMYDRSEGMPVVVHDVTVRMEDMQEGGQPEWSMAMINMWRDYTMRHWDVDKDMCFDGYVRAYLKKEGVSHMSKSTCNLAGISWQDVRDEYHKSRGARAGASDTLTVREV